MLRSTICLLALIASPVLAQGAAPTGETPPATVTTAVPVAPPVTVVTPTGPNSATVTHVPGVVATSTMKIQTFSDYDVDNNGNYSPMEFAQAMSFLANANPAAGGTMLPPKDQNQHKGLIGKMRPQHATALLNATADEFSMVDRNRDFRITPDELASAAMM